ncbi:hypothetical protein BOO69_00880 [Sulfitobacter alexandrii]|uniref:Uncharacterized protein n=1 Tax=Sulfitobacter alexandrii TaxID=1917485 RepID=A0A1J0WD81_9RHOB|nr:hypothetical protein [Sulfitobacter alexandrii]APE42118.1 hypothetical protein BOO69_00880 [Sulfitobacter alexandrii]
MTWLVGTFLLLFVGGPLVFRALTRPAPSRGAMQSVAVFALVCALFGFGLRFGLAGSSGLQSLFCLLALWLSWIGVLALATLAVRRVDRGPAMRRWSAVLGAATTTVPWFGLVSAQMMAG